LFFDAFSAVDFYKQAKIRRAREVAKIPAVVFFVLSFAA
jgi:hypothetical protein